MKNNKFCISRTLVYLVLLVVAVVGGLYVVGKMNIQNLSSKSKAQTTPSCLRYNNESYNPENRVIAYIDKDNNKCYGFTGLKTKYANKEDAKKYNKGKKIYYADDYERSDTDNNGCFMEEIPCFITRKIEKDQSSCPSSVYKWAPNPTPTGKTYGAGSNSFYGFQQICVKNTGYKKVGYKAIENNDSYEYRDDYECETTTKGVTEWNCNTTTSNPTPKLMTNYYGGYDESLCPKGTLIWLSYANNVNNDNTKKHDYDWEQLKSSQVNKDSVWDLCVKLTGYWQAMKDSQSGKQFYRCRYNAFSKARDDQCGGNYYYDEKNGQILKR